MLLKILTSPILIYRLFFNKWANKQAAKFHNRLQTIKSNGKTVHFWPEIPNQSASFRSAFVYLGYTIKHGWQKGEVNIAWHDETYKSLEKENINAFNLECTDISKSFLDECHHQVFGYGLSLDPRIENGKILEKSEINATRNARIIQGPCNPKKSFVYQKVVNNRTGLFYEDIRTIVIGNEIPIIYIYHWLACKRFSTKKISARIAKVNDYYSKIEQMQIVELCKKMGVDLAELDVLRDRENGKIYVVDVNPTAFGPAHGLGWKNKLKAIAEYAKSLEKLVDEFFKDNS